MPILYIKDKKGSFVPIPAIRGVAGKSAYEQAKEGGYDGTEEAFIGCLNDLTASGEHCSNFNNPHGVTASQIGAAECSETYLTISDGTFWEQNADGGYIQTVYLDRTCTAEIRSSDYPIVDIALGSDIEANKLYLKAWACISRIVTRDDNAVTLYTYDKKPEIMFNILIKVVR